MAASPHAAGPTSSLDEAYAVCETITKGHYENFSIATLFLPRALRRYFHAVYAFCRHTDDLGDEAEGDRLLLLNEWERQLDAVFAGTPTHPVMVALQDVVRRCGTSDAPFRKLIQANRMDQGEVRFDTYTELLYYCEHSATPVGRMILSLLGDDSPESARLSDATCTALQIANFWQDVARDYAVGRIYLPREDMKAFGCTEETLARGDASEAFRSLMRFEVNRTRDLFKLGLPLAKRFSGREQLDVALFSRGGMQLLEAIKGQDYDVLSKRPTISTSRKLWITLTTAARLAILKHP